MNQLFTSKRWPKYWTFSISPSSEHSGLISFRIDWFDLLAVQGTLKNLPQHHNLILVLGQCWPHKTVSSAFIFYKRWQRIGIIFSFSVWQNSPVKPSGPGTFCFGKQLIIDSIYLRYIGMPVQKICFNSCEFLQIVSFKKLVHFN